MEEFPWEKLTLYYHPVFQEHLVGVDHPEKPQRLQLIQDYLTSRNIWKRIRRKEPKAAQLKWIETTHSPDYIRHVAKACEKAPAVLDGGDTIVTEKSYQAALHAVGACTEGVDELLRGITQSVFCAVRPPGHHAEYAFAMGFCLFNNVAIAANYAIQKFGLSRILILDWDVHHGNGTQSAFEYSSDVLFISLHESPLYPGTGSASESGKGQGKGYNLNFPLPSGSGDAEYLSILKNKI
ncbi:MAG: histone deacetylase family protein, partial [Calditrichia bacterium]